MAISVNRLTNCNVYLESGSQLGKAEEVNLPDITYMMAEHKAVGMVGKVELPSGIDKMEASIKWNSYYPDVMVKTSDPFTPFKMQVRSSLEEYVSSTRVSEKPAVHFMTCSPKNFPAGNFKQHDNVELTTKFTVTAYRIEIDGKPIFEFDALANILTIDGVDKLATYRSNIGG